VAIQYGREFHTWLENLLKVKDKDKDSRTRLELALALLTVLRDLESPPGEDSATLKRVRQCRRYPVWRLAHPFVPGVAVRILAWFPDATTVVVALVGGDKGPIGDV